MESVSPLSQRLSNYILENHEVITNSKGNIKIDDLSLSGNGKASRFAKTILIPSKKNLLEIAPELLVLSDSDLIKESASLLPSIEENISNHLRDSELSRIKDGTGLEVRKEDYINGVPVVDMEDPKGGKVMIDTTTGRPLPMTYNSWAEVMGSQHVARVKEIGYCGRFIYNPYSLVSYKAENTVIGDEIIYNLYIPPTHKVERKENTLDPRFIKFMNTLFNESCRDYALNWIYHTTYTRSPVYLVLVGSGGIGKNLLAEALRELHGRGNFKKAPVSSLDHKFNGHLTNCTMLYYDECKFSQGRGDSNARKNRLKEWANDYVPIELKGVDAKDKDIFCSAIIATNNDSDVHIDQLDRKFSVMELSTERLEKRLGVDDAQFVWDYIKTDEFPHAFLTWLETLIDKDFNLQKEYRGDKFQNLVISSLSSWKAGIRTKIMERCYEYIQLSDLRDEEPMMPKSLAKINDFLLNFYEDGERLGSLVKYEGKNAIKVSDRYAPKTEQGDL